MLRVLVKKQLTEVFKSYFFDAKKNKMRSKGAIVAWFVFFIVIVVGMLGGIFTSLSMSLCPGLTDAGMDEIIAEVQTQYDAWKAAQE